MKDYVKKIAFVFSGLFIITGNFVLYSIQNVNASTTPKKYGAWTLNCTLNEKKKLCFLSQQINNLEKDKEKEILAIYHIGYFNQEQEEQELKIIEIVPSNVQIPAGTIINSGDKRIAAGKYVNCTVNGCQALATITQNDLDIILSNNNYVELITADGKQAKISFIKDGLKEGIKALSR
ncbi:chaperonin GroEL [Rickettsia canadensis str. McKiel]|uniref:Chaperonin GroEL n=2 Tax=Rickettsia canadensis TaxID=788 RepID=A8EY38_RICCK|nr:invasion associated locus B family protein [Rickettsia canadensis]ABV73271.1 chaperonin GroEL [Rickettsia canadensis str. McKiel]AFB20887.1 chaperonin GroEL [Rickettsia canadensis str. CA410]